MTDLMTTEQVLARTERALAQAEARIEEYAAREKQRFRLNTHDYLAKMRDIAEWYGPHFYQEPGELDVPNILRTFLFLVAMNADVPLTVIASA